MKQKLLEMVQVTVPIFYKIREMKKLWPQNLDFDQFYEKQQNLHVL